MILKKDTGNIIDRTYFTIKGKTKTLNHEETFAISRVPNEVRGLGIFLYTLERVKTREAEENNA